MPSMTIARAGSASAEASASSAASVGFALRLPERGSDAGNCSRAAANPARKPRRFASTALPSCLIAASKASTGTGSRPEPADRAEHHGVDDRPRLLRGRLHVEQDSLFRILLRGLEQALRIVAPVAHLHLLDGQIYAGDRRDQQGAVRGDKAVCDGAAGLEQFARHHQVDVADAGCEREHRALAAELGEWSGENLDVVGGGASALRHPGNGGRLHRQARRLRGRHYPIGKYAATLAAERGDQQRDGSRGVGHVRPGVAACAGELPLPACGERVVGEGQLGSDTEGPPHPIALRAIDLSPQAGRGKEGKSLVSHAATSRGASQPITVRRIRCRKRSHALAFWISSAR